MGESDTRHILFLPGTSSERIVAGELRGYGWDGRVPAVEAAELCRLRRAVIIPDDFPRLSPPAKKGEALKTYIDRAIAGHPLIAGFTALAVGLDPVRLLGSIHPEQWTCEWWQRVVQGRTFDPSLTALTLMSTWNFESRMSEAAFHRDRWVKRLMVELFDQLRLPTGYVIMHGIQASDHDQLSQPVKAGLWRHPDMKLDLLRYVFLPVVRSGRPAPDASLPTFSSLTLQSQATNDLKEVALAWMEAEAEATVKRTGKPPKRDIITQDCSAATQYPLRKCRDLYKLLPEHLRNKAN